VYILCCPIEWF